MPKHHKKGNMKKVKSIKDLEQLMESLGAVKDEEPGFTSWTLDCGPERQAPSSKPQASSFKLQAPSKKELDRSRDLG